MCWTQKFSFSADPVILDLKLQLAVELQILYSISIEFSISTRTKFIPNRILKRQANQAKYRS